MTDAGSPDFVTGKKTRGIAALMVAAGAAGFIAVALDLVFHGQLQRWDGPLHYWFHEHATPGLTLLFSAVSGLGELLVIVSIAAVVGGVLIAKKLWRTLAWWIAALCGSGILNPALKSIFRVPRPEGLTFYVFKPDAGWSFPSGHTMAVSITAGALALVILHHVRMGRGRRWMAGMLVMAISLLEAFALLYLGVHYLTDVVGGLMVSLGWLGVVRWGLPLRSVN